MSSVALLERQIRNQNRIFWRTPVAAFFTLGLPLIMLVLFVALFGNDTFDTEYGSVKVAQFYTPGLAVYSAASATFTNIAMNLANRRDLGILKRVRGTPMPPWMYLAGVVGSGVWIALQATVVMVVVGVAAYGVNIETTKIPAMVLTFVVGSATFAVLGVAVAAVARSAGSAQSITQVTILPLGFVSNVFISLGGEQGPPAWLDIIGDIFPLKHYAIAFGESMSPFSNPPAIEWTHLAVMLAWFVFGAVVAIRRFHWEPHAASRGSRRHRSRGSARH